jgi:hypothetical protein
MTDALKVKCKVVSARRIPSRSSSHPGIVIATCKSVEDKQIVFEAKAKLSKSRNFKDVFIDYDKSKEQRDQEANLRAIRKVIGMDKVDIRGSRLIPKRGKCHRDSDGGHTSPLSGRRTEPREKRGKGRFYREDSMEIRPAPLSDDEDSCRKKDRPMSQRSSGQSSHWSSGRAPYQSSKQHYPDKKSTTNKYNDRHNNPANSDSDRGHKGRRH